MALRVAVCGILTVARDGDDLVGPRLGSRKARILLAVLAASRGAPVSVERLTLAVWEEHPPLDPPGNLATLASRLRRFVGDDLVVAGPSSYALGAQVALDVDEAAALLVTATARLGSGEPTLVVAAASRALDLLTGGGGDLADECRGGWADVLRREVTESQREARRLLAAAATATGQTELATAVATAATAADPYDERAHRDLMSALVRDGRQTAALEVYVALVARLREDLGTDPDPETQDIHLSILRGELAVSATTVPSPVRPSTLVGREDELTHLDAAWAAAAAGDGSLVLVAGVPGIGKTRLLHEVGLLASASGGQVLATRCRPGERSLFLQPIVEALRPVLLTHPEPALRSLLGGHVHAWAQLLPELLEVLDLDPSPEVSPDLARRRSFDGVAAVLAGLAGRRPVLLTVDDMQNAADVTTDLVSHLATRLITSLAGSRVLVVAAARTDGLPALTALTDLTRPLLLRPLPASAVDALAAAAGFGSRADEVLARSQGHPLSVVATLQAMSGGSVGVPEDFATTVSALLGVLGPEQRRLVTAASVLGTRVSPVVLAGLVGEPEVEVVLWCEDLVRAGLLVTAGTGYEFTNDLVQEAVSASLPPPLAVAYHRRAADLLADRSEEMAGHAHAAHEPGRAARGWLQAGRRARRSGAPEDAVALLGSALTDAETTQEHGLVAAVLLERAQAREALPDYALSETDMLAAMDRARAASDPRLELRAHRLLGGDVSVARKRPLNEVIEHNRAGRELAARLGDSVAASVLTTRLAVIDSSRLRLSEALVTATAGVAEARATGLPEPIARSLDGLKNVYAYLGDAAGLQRVLDELLPLVSDLRLTWLLQWAVLESALVSSAGGHWVEARVRIDRAMEINRDTGYGAYAGFYRAQRGWLARLAGDLDAALSDGRRAVAETSPDHPWWYAAATGTLASTLLELGHRDEAATVSRAGLRALGDDGVAAYRVRCLAPLAAATGEGLEEADRLVAQIRAPAGAAWISGADVYQAVAAAWVAAGEPDRARSALRPLVDATSTSWTAIHERAQMTSATSSAARSAPSSGTGT